MLSAGVHAATDVTGFGLAGHLKEMIKENLGAEVHADRLPSFPEAGDLYGEGMLPSGFYGNKDFYIPYVEAETEGFLLDLMFDPQSSGGLLMALGEGDMDLFDREALRLSVDYWVVGRFTEEPKGRILVG